MIVGPQWLSGCVCMSSGHPSRPPRIAYQRARQRQCESKPGPRQPRDQRGPLNRGGTSARTIIEPPQRSPPGTAARQRIVTKRGSRQAHELDAARTNAKSAALPSNSTLRGQLRPKPLRGALAPLLHDPINRRLTFSAFCVVTRHFPSVHLDLSKGKNQCRRSRGNGKAGHSPEHCTDIDDAV